MGRRPQRGGIRAFHVPSNWEYIGSGTWRHPQFGSVHRTPISSSKRYTAEPTGYPRQQTPFITLRAAMLECERLCTGG